MKVVTSGLSYMDIDAYAGCIAYAEMLRLQDHDAIAASSAVLNESITDTVKSWDVSFSDDYVPKADDTFVLIDISEPEWFDKMVALDKVEAVIDHHLGYEQYWQDRLGASANIEFIGAACTLVFEEWERANLIDRMSAESAGLLMTGILDNTLNFMANVTTDRDKQAYEKLSKIAKLTADWPALYFGECQSAILSDLAEAIANDTKMINFNKLAASPVAVGQLVVWDAKDIIAKHQSVIERHMAAKKPEWFVNVVSIHEGKSYFISDNSDVKDWANNVLNGSFVGSVAEADRLWLRKEIVKADME